MGPPASGSEFWRAYVSEIDTHTRRSPPARNQTRPGRRPIGVTGPPPRGEGTLGHPIDDIEIVITQGGTEQVVARGAADDEYAFSVDIVVPSGLAAGEARVLARGGAVTAAFDATDAPLVLGDGPPSPAEDSAATFGPDEGRTSGADLDDAPLWPVFALSGVVAVGLAGAASRRRRGA
jgi:hypothetical protein